jgi:AcrR family transcriptional regulator
MPRPRSFVEDDVLEAALLVFWERGFDATSMDDLGRAMNLGRASLYQAFEDKEQIFQKALGRYALRFKTISQELDGATDALEWLSSFLHCTIDTATQKHGPKGCFVQLSSGMSSSANGHTLALITAARKSTVKLLRRALMRGRNEGTVCKTMTVDEQVAWFETVINGMAARARAGAPRRSFDSVIAQAINSVRM